MPAPELARLTHNALAFMPARSAVKVCRIKLDFDGLSIMATDLYTVGEDFCAVDAKLEFDHSIDLSRDDLQALDKAARAAKKETIRIVVRHQDGMEYFTEDVHGTFLDASAQRPNLDLWDKCDGLLTRLERGTFQIPEYLMIDPKLMAAFGKVKRPDGEDMGADLYISSPDDPILIKIGPTFRGALMPISREINARVNADGLWGT